MSLTKRTDYLITLLVAFQMPSCLAVDEKAKNFYELRENLASQICQDDVVCYEKAIAEASAVDALITIAQNSADSAKLIGRDYDDLRQWTLDFSNEENYSLQDYMERLELATIQVQPAVHSAMNKVISARPQPMMLKSTTLLPNELTKTHIDEVGLLQEHDAKECEQLCRMGTEDAAI